MFRAFDFVGQRIALDDQPGSATSDMVPILGMRTARIASQVNGLVPIFSRRVQSGVGDSRIATIAELAVISVAAERAGDNNQGSVPPKQTVEKTARRLR